MSDGNVQEEIEAIRWYHEFDFGGGLQARSRAPDVEGHRRMWAFVEQQLATIDFRGKTVLEVGCWDGYWSFWAERHGARSVLATDDLSQNWSDGHGILLAKRLLGSAVDIRQDVSVYQLASLGQQFDIVMCLGVFYHLLDPLLAFAQLRHCCHSGSLVLLEGDVARAGMHEQDVRYAFGDAVQLFLPSAQAFEGFLKAAYLRVQSQTWWLTSDLAPHAQPVHAALRARLRAVIMHGFASRFVRATTAAGPPLIDRAFTVCSPFEGVNDVHPYEPPFGLGRYDDRFRPPIASLGCPP